MNLIDLIKSSAGNLLRNKGRTLLTIIAIFIGSFTIYLTLGINTGVNNYMDLQLETVGNDQLLAVYKSDGSVSMVPGSNLQEYDPEKNTAEASMITPKDIEK